MTKHTQVASIANARPLLSLCAKYVIEPTATHEDLRNDAALLLEGVIGSIDVLATGLASEGADLADSPRQVAATLWGLLHQLRMIDSIVGAMEVGV